jgi:hypothetical protein
MAHAQAIQRTPGKKPPAPSVKRRVARTPLEHRSGSKPLEPSAQRRPKPVRVRRGPTIEAIIEMVVTMSVLDRRAVGGARNYVFLNHYPQAVSAQSHATNRLPPQACAFCVLISGYLPHAPPVVADHALALAHHTRWGQLLFRGILRANGARFGIGRAPGGRAGLSR